MSQIKMWVLLSNVATLLGIEEGTRWQIYRGSVICCEELTCGRKCGVFSLLLQIFWVGEGAEKERERKMFIKKNNYEKDKKGIE